MIEKDKGDLSKEFLERISDCDPNGINVDPDLDEYGAFEKEDYEDTGFAAYFLGVESNSIA